MCYSFKKYYFKLHLNLSRLLIRLSVSGILFQTVDQYKRKQIIIVILTFEIHLFL